MAKRKYDRPPTDQQRLYVNARLSGKNKKESKELAGYHPQQSTHLIEQSSGVRTLMNQALNGVGLDEYFLAKEIKASIKQCDKAKTVVNSRTGKVMKDPDMGSKANLLKLATSLKGYGTPDKLTLNQNITNITDGEARSLIEAIRAEIQSRRSVDVSATDAEVVDAEAHPGVGGPLIEGQGTGSGGQP